MCYSCSYGGLDQLYNYDWGPTVPGQGGSIRGPPWGQRGSGRFSSSEGRRQGGDRQRQAEPKAGSHRAPWLSLHFRLLLTPGQCPHTEELFHPVHREGSGSSGGHRGAQSLFSLSLLSRHKPFLGEASQEAFMAQPHEPANPQQDFLCCVGGHAGCLINGVSKLLFASSPSFFFLHVYINTHTFVPEQPPSPTWADTGTQAGSGASPVNVRIHQPLFPHQLLMQDHRYIKGWKLSRANAARQQRPGS